jgi:hypothetical protein
LLCKLIGLIATQGGVCVYIYIYIYIYMLLMKMMNPPHTQLSIFQNDKYINLIYNQTSVSISMWLKFTCRLLWCKAVGLIYSHTREIAASHFAFLSTLPLKLIQNSFWFSQIVNVIQPSRLSLTLDRFFTLLDINTSYCADHTTWFCFLILFLFLLRVLSKIINGIFIIIFYVCITSTGGNLHLIKHNWYVIYF